MMRLTTIALILALTLIAPSFSQEADPDAALRDALQQSISLDMIDIPLAGILELLQDTADITFVLDPRAAESLEEVDGGRVSLRVKNLSLANALSLISSLLELAWTIEDGVILIASEETLDARALEVVSYDIRDIVVPIEDHQGPGLQPQEEDGLAGAVFGDDSYLEVFSEEMLVELLQGRIAPESWDDSSFGIFSVNGLLSVRATSKIHESIEAELARLREFNSRRISIDIRLYGLSLEAWSDLFDAGVPLRLDRSGHQALAARAALLEQLTMIGTNSYLFHSTRIGRRAVVADFDVQVAQGAGCVDPIVRALTEGISADIRPVLAANEKTVSLDVQIELVRFQGEPRRVRAAAGAVDANGAIFGRDSQIDLPQLAQTAVRTLVHTPLGEGVVFPIDSRIVGDGEGRAVLIVTPNLVR